MHRYTVSSIHQGGRGEATWKLKINGDCRSDRSGLSVLDPKIMAGAPGVQSVDVLSDTEYLSTIKIKISFISANFKIKTILETRPPHYRVVKARRSDRRQHRQAGERDVRRPAGRRDRAARQGDGGCVRPARQLRPERHEDQSRPDGEEFGDTPPSCAGRRRPRPLPPRCRSARPCCRWQWRPAPTTPEEVRGGTARRRLAARWWSRLFPQAGHAGETIQSLRLPTDIYVEVRRSEDVIKGVSPRMPHRRWRPGSRPFWPKRGVELATATRQGRKAEGCRSARCGGKDERGIARRDPAVETGFPKRSRPKRKSGSRMIQFQRIQL